MSFIYHLLHMCVLLHSFSVIEHWSPFQHYASAPAQAKRERGCILGGAAVDIRDQCPCVCNL